MFVNKNQTMKFDSENSATIYTVISLCVYIMRTNIWNTHDME